MRSLFVFVMIGTGGIVNWIIRNFILAQLSGLAMVFGGASSGKSYFAEQLVISAGGTRRYIATAQALDAEMTAKITAHQQDRAADGWVTTEEPLDLADAVQATPEGEAILIDCATMWLSNLVMAEHNIDTETDRLFAALAPRRRPVVIVSNETGLGIVPDNPLARRFRQIQGRFNCRLAAQAGLVAQVTVGLPHMLKGQLPESAT